MKEEAGKAFGPSDAAPSRAAADAMTYTLSALQACHLESIRTQSMSMTTGLLRDGGIDSSERLSLTGTYLSFACFATPCGASMQNGPLLGYATAASQPILHLAQHALICRRPQESLRKYSVVPVVTRRCAADDEMCGHRIPAGTYLACSIQARHLSMSQNVNGILLLTSCAHFFLQA